LWGLFCGVGIMGSAGIACANLALVGMFLYSQNGLGWSPGSSDNEANLMQAVCAAVLVVAVTLLVLRQVLLAVLIRED